jgi:hypothetical protein
MIRLYGREWSAEDAAYAQELAADTSIPTMELVRLWAENRPSVRAARVTENRLPDTVNGAPVTEIGGHVTGKRRGRPKNEGALSGAERQRAYLERKRAKD